MKNKEAMRLAGWLDDVSEFALKCEHHISPKGSARELPPEAPTESESDAFRDGLVIGMQIASTMIEELAGGGSVEGMTGPEESYVRAIEIWVRRRRAMAESAGGKGGRR